VNQERGVRNAVRKATTHRRLAVAVIVALVAACGGGGADEGAEQTFVFAIEGDPRSSRAF
jgi:hypothetical protein